MPTTYLSLDYGTQRTGLAVGNDLLRTAQPLAAISTSLLHHPDGRLKPETIGALIREWKVTQLVIGLPLDTNGGETKLSRRVRELGQRIAHNFDLSISYVDERYTSGAADRLLRDRHPAGKRFNQRKRAARASVAAQLILETFFSGLPA